MRSYIVKVVKRLSKLLKDADSSLTLSDSKYADELSREEYERRIKKNELLSPRADAKRSAFFTPESKADLKGYDRSPTCDFADDEKAWTPFCNRTESVNEDELLAVELAKAEEKEMHMHRIGMLFDGDFAKHLSTSAQESKFCYDQYVNKKWDQVESYLDNVAHGICVSLLLPSLDKYELSVSDNFVLQLDACKKKSREDEETVEYNADYSFEGIDKSLSMDLIDHKYIKEHGILFLFIDRHRLRGVESQYFVSPSKKETDTQQNETSMNEKKNTHFVNKNANSNSEGTSKNSIMLRVKNSTFGKIFKLT